MDKDVPIWEKYTLTVEEAARYFRIGENKLRRMAEAVPTPEWVVMNGNRIQIKRRIFERMIDATAGTESCGQERAREQTEDMRSNTSIPMENHSTCTHGS